MGKRLLCLLIAACAAGAALAQTAPDADANIPVMLGLSTPAGKECSFTAKPGEPGHCLRPPDGMSVWLRGDDIWARVTILTQWKSPPTLKMSATSSGRAGESAWRLPDQVAGLPVARFGERSGLLLTAPDRYDSFTLLAVARQAPGARGGTLLSASRDEQQSIGWKAGNAVLLRAGPGATHELPFAGAQEFHVLGIRSVRGSAFVTANGAPLHEAPLALARFGVQFVGTAPSGEPVHGLAGLAALRAPANPSEGSDIAEIVLWPRALDADEMRTALRYLRRKYRLDFPLPDLGLMVADTATTEPAPTAAPAGEGPVLPGSAADPLAIYPAVTGRQFARTVRCSARAMTPDMPNYCLWPSKNATAWHRADDLFTMELRVSSWGSPIFSDLTAPDHDSQPEQVQAQIGRYPVVRFDDRRKLDFRTPLDLDRFTIYVVGRRAPTSKAGPIFSPGAGGSTYLYWHANGALVLGTWGAKTPLVFRYEGQDRFHMLTLRHDGAGFKVFVNGREAGMKPRPEDFRPTRLGHVGSGLNYNPSTKTFIDDIFDDGDGFSLTAAERAKISSEIAEILIYDRLLDASETEETERYLRKKYDLP
jgi:hypothetical protein